MANTLRWRGLNPLSPEERAAKSARASDQQRRWRLDNPDAAKAKDREARQNRDPVQRAAIMRSWRNRNRENVRAYDNAYKAAWRLLNPDAARMKGRLARIRRRARELNAEGSFTAADIERLFDEQKGLCVGLECGAVALSDDYEIDHKVALFRGGSNNIDNIQILCGSCNSRKHVSTMDEWRARTAA